MKSIIKILVLSILVLSNTLFANKIVGTLEPYSLSIIKSEISGIIKKINPLIGDEVVKNSILIGIDDRDYLLEYKMAQANENLSKINTNFLKDDYLRYKNLLKTKSITSQIHADRKKIFEESKVENLISSIATKQAERKLSKTKIRAPYNAVISNKYVEVGDYINTGDTLLELIDDKRLKAVFYILQEDYVSFEKGVLVNLNIPDLNNKKLKGKVFLIAPTIISDNSGYRMEVILDNKDRKIKADFEIELLVEKNKEED